MSNHEHTTDAADAAPSGPTLTLPDGTTVSPTDVFLFNDYPYRFRPVEGPADVPAAGPAPADVAFVLEPLYWGGSGMDIPFEDRAALIEQWDETGQSGTLAPTEWAAWLDRAREDDRFDDAEIDAVAAELRQAGCLNGVEGGHSGGLLTRLRNALGL